MPNHSIYALCEPGTLNVRYVGATRQSIKARLKEHLSTAKMSSRLYLHDWINGLDTLPNTVLLTTCSGDIDTVREVERAWIVLFIDNGYDMFNIRDCYGKGKKSKHRPSKCSDPVYFSNLIDRLIAEEESTPASKDTTDARP